MSWYRSEHPPPETGVNHREMEFPRGERPNCSLHNGVLGTTKNHLHGCFSGNCTHKKIQDSPKRPSQEEIIIDLVRSNSIGVVFTNG